MTTRDHPEGAITPELLAVVDPDPAVADAHLRKLLADLRRWFEWRGSADPEGAAAESICRALRRIADGAEASRGLRAYVFGVAKLVAKEKWKTSRREHHLEPAEWDRRESAGREQQQIEARVMLEQVQRLLSTDDWEKLLRYYTDDDHTAQSRDLGINASYLRVMIHRIREQLKAKIGDT